MLKLPFFVEEGVCSLLVTRETFRHPIQFTGRIEIQDPFTRGHVPKSRVLPRDPPKPFRKVTPKKQKPFNPATPLTLITLHFTVSAPSRTLTYKFPGLHQTPKGPEQILYAIEKVGIRHWLTFWPPIEICHRHIGALRGSSNTE